MTALLRELGIDGLDATGWLLLALPLAGVLIASVLRRQRAIPWPALQEARAAGARGFDGLRLASHVVRGVALLALVGVLAEPVAVSRRPAEAAGMDLVLVLDASVSMQALDAEVEGEWRRRIDLAREVVARFALHRVAEGDRVGLVVFGETSYTQCPLTRDGRLLEAALARVDVGVAGDSTALGDALALAVKRAGPAPERGPDGRLVVLLTDGRSNAGRVPVDVATGIARARSLRVHTVGIGSAGEAVPVAAPDGTAGRGLRFQRQDLDAEALERIASATGGRFYPVRSSHDLADVYAEIDALERVARDLPEEVEKTARPEPFLALAGALVAVELVAMRGARRRLP